MDVTTTTATISEAGALASTPVSDATLLSAGDGIPILTLGGLPFLSSDTIVNGVGTALGTGTPTILSLPLLRDGTIFGSPGSQGLVITTGPDGMGTVLLDTSQMTLLSQQPTAQTDAPAASDPVAMTSENEVIQVTQNIAIEPSVTETATVLPEDPLPEGSPVESSDQQQQDSQEQQEQPAEESSTQPLKKPDDEEIQPPHGKGPFKCDACDKEFPKWGQLQRHQKVHADDKPFRCDSCDASFNFESNLRLHRSTHCTSNPTCPECNKSFTRVASLKAHIMMHETEDNLVCIECGDEYGTPFQLQKHLKEHVDENKEDKIYLCKCCLQKFSKMSQLREHMKIHYRLKVSLAHRTYKKNIDRSNFLNLCTTCGKLFQKPSQLTRHYRIHTGERPFKCELCDKAFNQKGALQIHMTKHSGDRPFRCEFCPAMFAQRGNLRAHIKRTHAIAKDNPSQMLFQCDRCSCVFRKLGTLNAHLSRMHATELTPGDIQENEQVGSDKSNSADGNGKKDKPENVSNVNDVIQELVELSKQVNNNNSGATVSDHSDGMDCSKISSDILQQALENSGLTGTEKRTEKSNQNKPDDGAQIANASVEQRVAAAIAAAAAEVAAESNAPKAHTMVMTVADNVTGTLKRHLIRKVGGIRWHQCMYCTKEFKKPSDLVRHIRIHTHEKPYKCNQCFRTFNVKSTLTAHQRTHTGIKEFVCEVCNKLFSTQGSLKVHLRLHTGARPFSCPHCNRKFRTSGHRKSHILSHLKENAPKKPRKPPKSPTSTPVKEDVILQEYPLQQPILITETGLVQQVPKRGIYSEFLNESNSAERPYKCNICCGSFKKSSHLKQHLRTHTGEKPYTCPICQRSFVSNGVLKAHSRTHTGIKAFQCPTCNSTFTTNGSLKRHMCIHSDSRPFMCPYCQKTFKTSVNCKKHMKTHRRNLAVVQDGQQTAAGVTVTVIPAPTTSSAETGAGEMQQAENDAETAAAGTSIDGQFMETLNSIAAEDDMENRDANEHPQVASLGPQILTVESLSSQTGLTQENFQQLQQSLSQEVFNSQAGLTASELEGAAINTQLLQANPAGLDQEQGQNNFFSQTFESLAATSFTQSNFQNDALDVGTLASTFVTTSSALGTEPMATANMSSILSEAQDEARERDDGAQNEGLLALPCSEDAEAEGDANDDKDDDEEEEEEEEAATNDKAIKRIYQTCDYCGKSFKKGSHLKQHLRTHTGEKPYECHLCGKLFASMGVLNVHIASHSGVRQFVCSLCNATFTRNASLKRHMAACSLRNQANTTTATTTSSNSDEMGAVDDQLYQNECRQCKQVFTSLQDFQMHLRMHLREANEDSTGTGDISGGAASDSIDGDDTSEMINKDGTEMSKKKRGRKEKFILRLTDEVTAELAKRNLPDNASVSEKVLIASVAEKNRISEIKSKEIELENQPKYQNQCKHCPKSFKKPSDLIRHIRIHTGEKPYRCEICHKTFTVKSTLDSHVKTHSGEKNFTCHVCESLFATKGSLKVHMRLHTGAKPFKCPHCDLCFRTSGHRKSHIASHFKLNFSRNQHKPPLRIAAKPAGSTTNPSLPSNGDILVTTAQNSDQVPTSIGFSAALPNEITDMGAAVPSTSQVDQASEAAGSIQLQLTSGFMGPAVQITGLDPSLLAQTIQIDANLLQQLQQHGNINITISPSFIPQQQQQQQLPPIPTSDCPTVLTNRELSESVAVNPNVVIHSLSNLGVPLTIENTIISAELNEDQIPTATTATELAIENGSDMKNDAEETPSRPASQNGDINKTTDELEFEGISGSFADNVPIPDNPDLIPGLQLLNSATGGDDGSDKASEKMYTCFVCHKSFRSSQHLNEHILTHNPEAGTKPTQYPCPCCDKSFQKPSQLERHIRIHTGEKPFQCEECDKAFNQKSALVMHAKLHRGDRPHKCPYCDQSFTQKGNLSLHLKRKHGGGGGTEAIEITTS